MTTSILVTSTACKAQNSYITINDHLRKLLFFPFDDNALDRLSTQICNARQPKFWDMIFLLSKVFEDILLASSRSRLFKTLFMSITNVYSGHYSSALSNYRKFISDHTRSHVRVKANINNNFWNTWDKEAFKFRKCNPLSLEKFVISKTVWSYEVLNSLPNHYQTHQSYLVPRRSSAIEKHNATQ